MKMWGELEAYLPCHCPCHRLSLCNNRSGTLRPVLCPLPPAPTPSSHSLYSGHAAVVRAIPLEDGSILQEHGTGLEDEGGKQLHVDVVPGAVEPPGRGKRDEHRGLQKTFPGPRTSLACLGNCAEVSQDRVAKATSNQMRPNELGRK